MTILGIDTATQVCSVGIVRDGSVIAERSEFAPRRHAELLMPFVEEVMNAAGLSAADLNAIAVSIGPGSFTGLRIGLSIVKGIATGAAVPVIPVPTMDAIAVGTFRRLTEAATVVVLLPARTREYYYGRYRRSNRKPELLTGIHVYSTEEVAAALSVDPPDSIAGEGIERLSDEMGSSPTGTGGVSNMITNALDSGLHTISAALTASIGIYYDAADIATLEPLYIKHFGSGSPKQP